MVTDKYRLVYLPGFLSVIPEKGNVGGGESGRNQLPDNVAIYLRKLPLRNDMTDSHMKSISPVTFGVLMLVCFKLNSRNRNVSAGF